MGYTETRGQKKKSLLYGFYRKVIDKKRKKGEKNYDFWLNIHLPDGEELGLRLILCEQREIIHPSLKTTKIYGDLRFQFQST